MIRFFQFAIHEMIKESCDTSWDQGFAIVVYIKYVVNEMRNKEYQFEMVTSVGILHECMVWFHVGPRFSL